MQNVVTISGTISFGMHYRATRAIIAHSRINLFGYFFFVAIPLTVLAIMLAIKANVTHPYLLGLPFWAALLLGPATIFLFFPLCHALNVWQMRRRNESVRGILTFTVNDDGFKSHGSSFDVNLRWEGIHKVIETRDFFLFYVASSFAHFIPKVCIDSPEELQTIREIVHMSLGEKAKLLAVCS